MAAAPDTTVRWEEPIGIGRRRADARGSAPQRQRIEEYEATLNRLRRPATLAAALLALALTACGMMGDLRDLSALQTAVAKSYGETAAVNLSNGKLLTVTFQNSKFATLDGPSRSDFARGVAVFAFTQYARRDSLTSVSIGFRSVKGAGGFTLTTTDVPYSWTATELRSAADSLPHTLRP
jgi:hypothetical protein